MYASTIGLMVGAGVGIGTTAPNAALHIKNATTAMRITGNLTNASTRPVITTTPGAFEIRGSGALDGNDAGFLRLSAGDGTSTNQKAYIDLSGYSTVADMGSNIVFGAQGTERMRITAAALQVASGLTTDLGAGLKTKYTNMGVTAASVVALNTVYNGAFSGSGPYTFTTNSSSLTGFFAIATGLTVGAVYQISVTCYSSNVTSIAVSDNNTITYLVTPITSSSATYTTPGYASSNTALYIIINTPSSAVGLALTFSSITVQRLDTVATGNVGIGVTNPGYKLDVSGNVNVGVNNATYGSRLYFNGTNACIQGGPSGSDLIHLVSGNGTKALSVAYTGNVGIGLTNPRGLLEIFGRIAPTATPETTNASAPTLTFTRAHGTNLDNGHYIGRIAFSGADNSWSPQKIGADISAVASAVNYTGLCADIAFGTLTVQGDANPTEKMRITRSGNVGIGITNPSATLHVNGGIRSSNVNSVSGSLTVGTSATVVYTLTQNQSGFIYFFWGNGSALYFMQWINGINSAVINQIANNSNANTLNATITFPSGNVAITCTASASITVGYYITWIL